MENDAELSFIQGLAEIKDFEKQVKSLKLYTTKLDKKITALELSGFQDQIAALGQKINRLSERIDKQASAQQSLLSLYKDLQKSVVTYRLFNLQAELMDILNSSKLPNIRSLQTEIVLNVSNVKHQIQASKNPFALLDDFSKNWEDRLRKLGCEFINY